VRHYPSIWLQGLRKTMKSCHDSPCPGWDLKWAPPVCESRGAVHTSTFYTFNIPYWEKKTQLVQLATYRKVCQKLTAAGLSISNLKTTASKLKHDYSLHTLRVNIRILMRRSLASNWSSVDEDLRAQVKARRVSRRAQAWRAWARARVMWTGLKTMSSTDS
jgi:hypothetical protein